MPEPYQEYREKPWGHETVVTPPGRRQIGKLIFVKAGCKLSLQYHDLKEETITLHSGKALLWFAEKQGDEIAKIPMAIDRGYFIASGNVHRYEALEDSLFFEVSSPEAGTTFRLEDDYGRTDEVR